jgi:hypothetical protein
MSNNQKLFKDAIADAKTLREVAVANAKAALEESFMPRIQSMFEKRIMESEELEEAEEELKEKATYIVDKDNLIDSLDENEEMEEEIDLEELFNSLSEEEDMEEGYGAREYEMGKKAGEEMMEEEDLEEDYDLEEILRELEEESNEIYEEEDSMEEGTDEDLNENSMFEKAGGKENIDEVTVDELRDMIQDAIRAVMGGEAGVSGEEEMDMDVDLGGEDEMDMDLEAGEEEETEEKPKKKSKKDELDELFALYEKKKEELDERRKYKGGSGKKDDLDESAEAVKGAPFGKGGAKSKIGAPYGAAGDKKSGLNGAYKNKLSMKLNEKSKDLEEVEDVEEAKKMKDDLEEAINVIKTLRGQLNEVNLLNAKLIYVNKIFKANQLTENQKVNVVNSFDKAQTLTEAKNIYEVLKNTVKTSKVTSKTTLKEHKSFASSIVGGTTAKSPIISADDTITRMQELAGIITK